MKKFQDGFSAIEGLLIVIIASMLGGVGYYVWHAQQQVDKTYSQTSNSSVVPKKNNKPTPISSTGSNQKYLVIKEWGVRAPYSNDDTLTYKVDPGNGTIAVISKNLSDKYGCNDFGAGNVARLAPTDKVPPTDAPVSEAAQAQPD